jgi:hypothetical protein
LPDPESSPADQDPDPAKKVSELNAATHNISATDQPSERLIFWYYSNFHKKNYCIGDYDTTVRYRRILQASGKYFLTNVEKIGGYIF